MMTIPDSQALAQARLFVTSALIFFFFLDLSAAISQAVASITSVGQPSLRPTYDTSGSNKGHYHGASDIPNVVSQVMTR